VHEAARDRTQVGNRALVGHRGQAGCVPAALDEEEEQEEEQEQEDVDEEEEEQEQEQEDVRCQF